MFHKTDNPVLLSVLNRSDDICLAPSDWCKRNGHHCRPIHLCACETERARKRTADSPRTAIAFRYFLEANGVQIKVDRHGIRMAGNLSIIRAVQFNGMWDEHAEELREMCSPTQWDIGASGNDWFDIEALEKLPPLPISDEEAEYLELAGILEYDGGATRQAADIEARRIIRKRDRKRREAMAAVTAHVKSLPDVPE